MSIAQVQPYLTAVATVFSLATLGMILRLSASFRQLARDRAELLDEKAKVVEERFKVVEERNKSLQDELSKSEAWFKRQEEIRKQENDDLKTRLNGVLTESGATLDVLAIGKITGSLETSVKNAIDALVARMEARQAHDEEPQHDADWHLQLARGHMVRHDWLKAAEHFDAYVKLEPDDRIVQFSRATAYANAREGHRTDLASMRSYGEALALVIDGDDETRAVCLTRRGAMLKRLGRLDEANADLQLALGWAEDIALRKDVLYNLACVHSLRGERDELLSVVRQLKGSYLEVTRMRSHLDTYFANFANDEEFRQAIGAHLQ